MRELSREEIEDAKRNCTEGTVWWFICDMALAHFDSKEAGRVSVPMTHQGECATDESAKQVCEGMYTDKVDEVLSLIEALESIATLNAGSDEQAQAVRQIALKAIAEQGTDIDAAGEARTELRAMLYAMLSATPAPAATTGTGEIAA